MRALGLLILAARLGAQAAPAELPLYARGAALGGACGACQGTAESLWLNPAGLVGPGWELGGGSLGYAQGLSVFGGQLRLSGQGVALAMGLQGFGLQEVGRDAYGQPTQLFDYGEQVLSGGLALGDERLSIGGALRRREISWGSASLGSHTDHELVYADLGLQGRLPWRAWRAGLALRGLSSLGGGGGNCYFCFPEFRMSQPEYLGALAWQPGTPGLQLLAGYAYDSGRARGAWQLGLEQWRPLGAQGHLALRTGWRSDQASLGSMAGFSAGIGFQQSVYRFDYAFSALGEFGLAHRASLSLLGGAASGPETPAPASGSNAP